MDRNNLKVTDQQELQRRASLCQQLPSRKLTSGIQRRSSAPSTVFKGEGTQLETFQSLTFPSEHNQEFGTLQDFSSGSYNPQTPQYSQRETQTQAQIEDFSQVRCQEQTYFKTPLLPQSDTVSQVQIKDIAEQHMTTDGNGNLKFQSQETEYKANKSRERFQLEGKDGLRSTETEHRVNQSLSELTASVSKAFRGKRVRHQEMETIGKVVGENKVEGQTELTAPQRKLSATSEDRWEQSLQQNHTHVWAPKHANSAYESNLVQHFNISPPLRKSSVSPRAWRNQEVIVSFKAANDHIQRVSSSNVETLSTGCDETKTHFQLCKCRESKPGSSTGSLWVKGREQASTAATAVCLSASNNTSQASTPLKYCTFPMHSTTRSSSSEDGDNPPSQCHQFPKLPSRPPCLGPQDSYLEGDYASDAHSEAEEGWMFLGKLKQNQRPGSGLVPQQQPSSSCLNKDNRTHGKFSRYLTCNEDILIFLNESR